MTYPTTVRLNGLLNRVFVAAHEIAVRLRDGQYAEVLGPGTHWMTGNNLVVTYNRTAPIPDITQLPHAVLLDKMAVRQFIDALVVPDGRLALEYREGLIERVLRPGRYLYWDDNGAVEHVLLDPSAETLPADLPLNEQLRALLAPYLMQVTVFEYESAVLYRNGRLAGQLAAGEHPLWNVAGNRVSVVKTDLRAKLLEISGQEVLTLDKAMVRLNIMLTYRVVDALRFLTQTSDAERQVYVATQLATRAYVGTRMLDQLLSRDGGFAEYLREALASEAERLGIALVEIGLRDVILPGEMRDILNRVLVAEKTVQANVILRRDETAATRALLNTAKLMDDHPMLLRLKEMEYVGRISDNVSTITLNGRGEVLGQLRDLLTAGGD